MKRALLGMLVGSSLASATAVLAQAPAAQVTQSSRSILTRYAFAAAGNQVVRAGTVARGSVLVINGNLDVYGDVAGAATVIGGDLIVHDGGRIRGAAVSMFGKVRNEGGSILGVVKHVGRTGVHTSVSLGGRPRSTGRSLAAAFAWLVALLLLGASALFFAGDYLKRVVQTVSNEMGKSLFAGVLGGLSALPVMVAIIVALAITLIGIVFIPIGVAAFAAIVFAMGLLGLLAVAQVVGMAVAKESAATETPAGNDLRYLVSGVLVFSSLWIVAAAFTWMPLVGTVLRVFAASITLVAVLTGFGAVIIAFWRLRRERRSAAAAVAV